MIKRGRRRSLATDGHYVNKKQMATYFPKCIFHTSFAFLWCLHLCDTLRSSNLQPKELWRCRNATCAAPTASIYPPILDGGAEQLGRGRKGCDCLPCGVSRQQVSLTGQSNVPELLRKPQPASSQKPEIKLKCSISTVTDREARLGDFLLTASK